MSDKPITGEPQEPSVLRYDHHDGQPPYQVILKRDYDALRALYRERVAELARLRDEALRYIERQAVLEEAAKVCEEEAESMSTDEAHGAYGCAAAIRALS